MAHQGRFEDQKQGEEDDAWHRLLIEPTFERTCLQKFGFLEKEFGFALRSSETTSYGSHVTYTNQTTGVRVSLEPREGGIFVELSRLADGELPSVPIFIESDSVLNSFDLDDILLLRSAPTGKQLDTSSALTADEIERELERYASALRAYAPDILWGDFELFPQLASLVKRRKRVLDDSYE
jgi:hypothetical protein